MLLCHVWLLARGVLLFSEGKWRISGYGGEQKGEVGKQGRREGEFRVYCKKKNRKKYVNEVNKNRGRVCCEKKNRKNMLMKLIKIKMKWKRGWY